MTRKLFLGLLAVAVMSLWYVGCTKDDGPVPVDEHPPVLERLDVVPDEEVCGPFDIIGNVTDVAEAELDPTGVDEIWVTLDGVEIEAYEPGTNCEVSVEFAFTDIEIDGPGLLALHAKDCEGNEKILHQVDIDAVFDDVDPVVTFTNPTEGDTLIGDEFLITVDVESDADVTVYLEIDGIDYTPDSNSPYQWLVMLDERSHLAHARAEDGCEYEGFDEVNFFTDECADNTAPEVVITNPGDIECMPHDIYASVTDSEARELIDVWAVIGGVEIQGLPDAGDTFKFRVREGLVNGTNLVTVYANDGCGNIGEDEVTVNYSCPDCIPMVTAPVENELLCDTFTFMAEVDNCDRELPTIEEVCFYFDGAQSYAYCDQDGSDGWGYTTDVSLRLLEPGNHYVVAKATLVDLDGNETISTSSAVNFIVSCQPTAVLDLIMVDPCAGIIEVTGIYSYDDNTEPGLTYEFTSPTCEFELTQSSPTDPQVTMDFSANFCGFGDYVIILTVDDQWGWTHSDTLVVPMDNPAPVISGLEGEHSDGNYYGNAIGQDLGLLYTDAIVCDCTTYEFFWEVYNDDDELIFSDSGTDLMTLSYEFPALGSYEVCAWIVETVLMGDPCTVPFVLTSETECWNVCLEDDLPIIDSFDVENLIFAVDEDEQGDHESPYCNLWVNEHTNLVSEEGVGAELITWLADDDLETEVCISGCDYFTLEFVHGEAASQFWSSQGDENCDISEYDVNWDNFAAGEWTVTFTIFDKSGNSATATEVVIKSDFPSFGEMPNEFRNFFEGEYECYLDPLGVPVRFDGWFADDDNGSVIDSLVFEFSWDYGTTAPPADPNCPSHRDILEEVWDYHGPDYGLPWTYYVPDYGHHWVRIWACDQYDQWSKSEWVPVEAEDYCDPDWEFNLNIDSVEGINVDPHIADWDRVDIESANDIDFCIDQLVEDREGFNDHGIANIYFYPFNVYDGYDVDGDGDIEGAELTYWIDLYGDLPEDGTLGDGTSSCTHSHLAKIVGGSNLCTNNTYNWDAKTSPWYGCCGFFYVYAIAEDNNGNWSMPSAPIVIFKYSEPILTFCDCYTADVNELVTLDVDIDNECSADVDTIYYEWDYNNDLIIDESTTLPTVDHAWTVAGLYEVTCTVTVVDAEGTHTDTATTWVSVGDVVEPAINNLDVDSDFDIASSPFVDEEDRNNNYCNEGDFDAQYGWMHYTVAASDVNGILQGPHDHCDPNTWTVEVTLWSDVDGSVGDSLEVIADLLNGECGVNEKEWQFPYFWGTAECPPDGVDEKPRGYYWMRARVRDRSGNFMGQDTSNPDDDYFSIRLFHSDPPSISVDCDYTNLNNLRFTIEYDCLTICDDAPLTSLLKTQWDQTMPASCYRWYQRGYADDHCDGCYYCTGTPYGTSTFDYQHEYDWSDTEDNIVFDYFESGDGYGWYYDDDDTSTSMDDNPAAVRVVDEDGIYSDVILFDVYIEDVTEPCIEWQDPVCEVVNGVIDLVVWASDYPEHDSERGIMPCISRVDFFVDDHYAGSEYFDCDAWDEETYDGEGLLCDVADSPYFEFVKADFNISAFLDSVHGYPACGWGGVVELEARAYDVDGNQSGDAAVFTCESNTPQIIDGADDCEWASNVFDVELDFTSFICDDNPLDFIWIDWDDGSSNEKVFWANAGNVEHTFPGVGCYDIQVQVYDYYSTEDRCCDDSNAGPFLDWTFVGSVLIDQTAPIVDRADMLPGHDTECVSVDPTELMDITVTSITDDDSFDCYGEAGIDWVKFWVSDDGWTNKEYLGQDTDGTDGWSYPWNPWNQESKQIWFGIEVMDCAGNSVEFFMEEVDPDDEYWFFKDLRPWVPIIDHHEVWALLESGCGLPFQGDADNDPGDEDDIIYSWYWEGEEDCPDASYPDNQTPTVSPAALGVTDPGEYILVLAAEDDCWTYCDDEMIANADTATIYLCDPEEGPSIVLDSPDPADPVEGMDFEFCFTVDDCFYWEDGFASVVSSVGDTLYVFPFQSPNQWNPNWDPCYSYFEPNGEKQYCFTIPVGGEDCMYYDVHGNLLGYNPFAHGSTFDLMIEATDYHPDSPVTTYENFTFTISDVLGPYVNNDGFWYGDDYDFEDGDELLLDDAVIDFGYNGGNAIISIDAIDWHCSDIKRAVFVFQEPSAEWEYVDEDNIFGTDLDPSDGLTAVLSLPVPSDVSYKVGVFLWDEYDNVSLQSSVNFFSAGTLE